MKNIFFIAATLFLGSFIASAQDQNQTPAEVPSGAVITFEFETYDFGDIDEGAEASVDFVFTNTGTEKLILTDVKASCGCTVPSWSREPVMPGEKGIITAKYNTVGRPGPFNKAITVTSNAGGGTIRIFIKGTVIGKAQEDISNNNNGVPERAPSIVNDVTDN